MGANYIFLQKEREKAQSQIYNNRIFDYTKKIFSCKLFVC